MPLNDRWEQGSEFHWPAFAPEPRSPAPWRNDTVLYGTGRDALRALLSHQQTACGSSRLWVPSYFCQSVVASLMATGIRVMAFPDYPDQALTLPENAVQPGEIVLVVNYFGLRRQPIIPPGLKQTTIVEDHTHDPWSGWAQASEADWCIASLRKVLPVPDGGVLWSPARHPLPAPPPLTESHGLASLEKAMAMVLKAEYLGGGAPTKETFRQLAVSGETRMGKGDLSGITPWSRDLLGAMPILAWRAQRRRNWRELVAALQGTPSLRVLQPPDDPDMCPFSAILVFPTRALRDRVYDTLLAKRVYPAILWPLDEPVLEGIPRAHQAFSEAMLSIHCDARYDETTMRQVAALVRDAVLSHTENARLMRTDGETGPGG